MAETISVLPIDDITALEEVFSPADLFTSKAPCFYRRASMTGAQGPSKRESFDGLFFALPNGRMIFDGGVLYTTSDNRFLPCAYPKAWPYEQFAKANNNTLDVDLSVFEQHDLSGTWFAPCNVPAAPHLYHNLFDNYARMHFIKELPSQEPLSVVIPTHGDFAPDVEVVHHAFAGRYSNLIVRQGIYEFERLIIPPLANKNDYMFAEPMAFLTETLSSLVKKRSHSYGTRIYVSRADTKIRNLTNERELVDALRALGFTILCPGEFHIKTQLELFSAAEVIVGLHGMGLIPMLVAQDCKAVFEYEALGWETTAFRGITANMGIHYEALPCRLVSNNPAILADWTAEADIGETVKRIQAVLSAGVDRSQSL